MIKGHEKMSSLQPWDWFVPQAGLASLEWDLWTWLIFCCWVGPVPYLELFWAGPVKKVTLYISGAWEDFMRKVTILRKTRKDDSLKMSEVALQQCNFLWGWTPFYGWSHLWTSPETHLYVYTGFSPFPSMESRDQNHFLLHIRFRVLAWLAGNGWHQE